MHTLHGRGHSRDLPASFSTAVFIDYIAIYLKVISFVFFELASLATPV